MRDFNNYPQGLYLGIDYGTKKIGFALGQTITLSTRPLSTINYKNNDTLWSSVQKIMAEWQPQAIVVGLPLNEDLSHSDTSLKVITFCEILKKRYDLPVYMVNEHLSSFEAKLTHKEHACGKQSIDAIAASIILETWFRQHLRNKS